MNVHLVPKIINLYVVKLSNSGAITCVSRLDLDHFEHNLIRPDLIRGSLEISTGEELAPKKPGRKPNSDK